MHEPHGPDASRFPHGPRRSWARKFRYAFRGVCVGARGEDSFFVHLPAALLVLVAAGLLRLDRVQFCLLLLCITIVLVAEYFNTALEWLAKAVDEDHNQALGNALDIASGAVLVAAGGASLVGIAIFVMRLFEIWQGIG